MYLNLGNFFSSQVSLDALLTERIAREIKESIIIMPPHTILGTGAIYK